MEDLFKKLDMSRMVKTTGILVITFVGGFRGGIAKKDTRRGPRLNFGRGGGA